MNWKSTSQASFQTVGNDTQRQDNGHWRQPDDDVGDDFTDHQLEIAYRRCHKQFHIAALSFPDNSDGSEPDHGQNDTEQPRNDGNGGTPFRVIAQPRGNRFVL